MSMACLYSIVAYGRDARLLRPVLEEALDEVDRIDRLMSHYRADSPLSRINREAAARAVMVEPELFEFIAMAIGYGIGSDGAFDITVGPLMKAWGFFGGEGRLPDPPDLLRARNVTGYAHVVLDRDRRTIRFDRPGVEIDLGGIAKGYAVDRAVGLLRRRGTEAALVSAGGSTLFAMGAPPDSGAWDIDIQHPVDAGRVAFRIPLSGRALSIAGASEKWFEAGGVRYTHIMDPRTGRPVQGVLSVLVLSTSGTEGDALDDALFVRGVEQGPTLLGRYPATEAYFLLPDERRGWRSVHVSAPHAGAEAPALLRTPYSPTSLRDGDAPP
jgi:FAD:protein FMN transferase